MIKIKIGNKTMSNKAYAEGSALLLDVFHRIHLRDLPIHKLSIVLRRIMRRLILIDSKLELIFEIASLDAGKFAIFIKQLRKEILEIILRSNYNKLKLLLIHLAYICPKCFVYFILEFKEPLSRRLLQKHFNDIILLVIEIARVREDLGIIFVREYLYVLRELSRGEGITHLGTVVWHINRLGYKRLAWQIFDGLIGIFIEHTKDPAKVAWLLLTLNKIDADFLKWAINKLRSSLINIINEAPKERRKAFISIIRRDNSVFQQISFIIGDCLSYLSV